MSNAKFHTATPNLIEQLETWKYEVNIIVAILERSFSGDYYIPDMDEL